jgi:hypothetical protein
MAAIIGQEHRLVRRAMSTPYARSTPAQPDSSNGQPSRSFAQAALSRYWNSPLSAIFLVSRSTCRHDVDGHG